MTKRNAEMFINKMTKRNAEMFIYDPEKQYDIADFENTTIKNLYKIGKSLGVRDVKKPKKNELARIILSKHVAEQEKVVSSVLNEIIDNVVEKGEQLITEMERTETLESSVMKMKENFNKINFFKVNNDIFFHGKEVAKYLEYSNCADAIYKIVDINDKIAFHELKSDPNVCVCQTITFHPETMFINQDGLFDLVMKSRMPLALHFRKWLLREVIPSILNTGAYVSPQISDKQVQELQIKLDQLEQEKNELNLKIENLTTNPYINQIQRNRLENTEYKMEQLYIITSKEYAKHYVFKIGKSVDPFKRLLSLNTGMIKDSDQLYICYAHNCLESINVEKHIHMTLHSYRYKNNREFFVIKFHILKNIIDRCCKSNNLNLEEFIKEIEEDNHIIVPEISTFIPERINIPSVELSNSNQITNYFSHV